MDPHAALNRLRELAAEVFAATTNEHKADLADEMAEVFDGLDEWLKRGGFSPWAK